MIRVTTEATVMNSLHSSAEHPQLLLESVKTLSERGFSIPLTFFFLLFFAILIQAIMRR